jgi:hypothetical protein
MLQKTMCDNAIDMNKIGYGETKYRMTQRIHNYTKTTKKQKQGERLLYSEKQGDKST